MQISFLLGPAGTGKTFRCLSEIRSELARCPEGPPLILLAPKQATFQLERQLLEGSEIQGYARLQILSFERLARFVFEACGEAAPQFISNEGCTMVLRALLNRAQGELAAFGGAARRQGFAEEVAGQFREFGNHGLTPAQLRKLAVQIPRRNGLAEKLLDFALLYERYRNWLTERRLQDADALLSTAADLLEAEATSFTPIAGLWVDGFAQLTPEERRLLVALLRFSKRSVVAFCVDPERSARLPISPWFLVSQTLAKCRTAIEMRYQCEVHVETLSRHGADTRFARSPALRQLETEWGRFEAPAATVPAGDAVSVRECADPEAEAICCAREIIEFVRQGGRFRETAVLVRDFHNDYPHVLRRVLRRYEIPFFIDHREGVAHHPLAELTRGALRAVAYDWEQRDWFTVLKSGLIPVPQNELDQIENEALARGWRGAAWREGLRIPRDAALEREMNERREKIMPPFITLAAALVADPSGKAISEAIRKLWRTLGVEEQLENWAKESPEDALHATVWEQMNAWLDNVQLAFGEQRLPVRQWIPILEAGLSSLTVGIIPPVLDEVLIGSVDRSRNPDLRLLCILGFNEHVFPAVPGHDTLLTDDDRTQLLATGSDLAHSPAFKLAAEQFYGYIACTRPREALRICYARTGLDGTALNASRFLAQLKRIFPELTPRLWNYPREAGELLHPCELPLLGIHPDRNIPSTFIGETLAPEVAERLYGKALKLSVSALERFASCPHRFFLEYGLRLEERKEFSLDVREQGSFQHEVLAAFHEQLVSEGKKWRDLTASEARVRIGSVADAKILEYGEGLMVASEQNLFTAESYKKGLQEFIAVIIDWFNTNRFDPERVEFGFGGPSALPGWEIPLSEGHRVIIQGRIDRIDLHRSQEGETYCVIIDYKSGAQRPDKTLLHHGIQQQLTAYLLALTRVPEVAAHFGVPNLRPAGGFLLPLRARFEPSKSRKGALADVASARRNAYGHHGLFDVDLLPLLDSDSAKKASGQFKYRLNKDGAPHAGTFSALPAERFREILGHSEILIRRAGEGIYAGEIAVEPYKRGQVTACDKCKLLPVCRFDSWTQPFKTLTPPPKADSHPESKAYGKK